MNSFETKQAIVRSLADFGARPLLEATTALFEALGYAHLKRHGGGRPKTEV